MGNLRRLPDGDAKFEVPDVVGFADYVEFADALCADLSSRWQSYVPDRVETFHDDLDRLWAEIEGELSERGLRLFPAPLLRAPLEPGTWLPARRLAPPRTKFSWPMIPYALAAAQWSVWPRSAPFGGFLDLASEVRSQLVYGYRWFLEAEEIADLEAALGDAESGSDQARAIDEASAHLGFPWLLQLAFVHEGVGHYFWQEASWHESLVRRVRQIMDESAVVDEAEAQVKVDTWARMLAEDPAFQRAGTKDARIAVAKTLLSDLDASGRDGRALRGAAVQGWRLYKEEIPPRQEADVARQAHQMLAEGVPKTQTAGRLGIGVDRLNSILGQYQ